MTDGISEEFFSRAGASAAQTLADKAETTARMRQREREWAEWEAKQKAEETRQEAEEASMMSGLRGRLETACRESGFSATLEALSALPEDKGRKFQMSVDKSDIKPCAARMWYNNIIEPAVEPAAITTFMVHYGEPVINFRVFAESGEDIYGYHTASKYSQDAGDFYDKKKFTDMNQAFQILADWVGSVAPERVRSGELQRQMSDPAPAVSQEQTPDPVQVPATPQKKGIMSRLGLRHRSP